MQNEITELRNQVRTLKRIVYGFGCVLFAGVVVSATSLQTVPDVIQVKRFEVVNSNSNAVVKIEFSDAGQSPDDDGTQADASPPQHAPLPPVVDAQSLTGKLMFGYQGWFGAQGDGSAFNRWRHWSPQIEPTPDHITVDMWPDLREFDDDELFQTGFRYDSGEPAHLFSSSVQKTVHRHFDWMREHGLDGVFLQQFVCELRAGSVMRSVRDQVMTHVASGARRSGRIFALMYDISGSDAELLVEQIKAHWRAAVDQGVVGQGRYLNHNGRPLVALWGFGFLRRPGSAAQASALVNWFHHEAPVNYQATVMGGVPTHWRTLDGDAKADPAWRGYYSSLDIISPWTVGRFADDGGLNHHVRHFIEPDLIAAHRIGADYLPVVWPGFSWSNLRPEAQINQIPRRGGRFWWSQFHRYTEAGAGMIYAAMFDEVDEGTAMFKIAENSRQTPAAGRFVTLDADGEALPSDWYLRLAGVATRVLRGDRAASASRPINP